MTFKKNGVNPLPQPRSVTLVYHQPDAQSVIVTGDFCDWQTDRYPLKKDKKGFWTTTITLAPGRYEYRYVVDGEWLNDPNCAERAANDFGSENCVLLVQTAEFWFDLLVRSLIPEARHR